VGDDVSLKIIFKHLPMVDLGAHEHHGNQYLKSDTAQPTMII